MAQEPEDERNGASIARAGKRKWGYDPEQVDAFLERAHALYEAEGVRLTQRDIQNVSFDLTKNGYDIAQVDAALARLERAVVDKQTTWEIGEHGRVAWKAQTEELYRQIAEHASREAGQRFQDGKKKHPSYDRKQVDRLVDQIVDKAAAELGIDGMRAEDAKALVDLNSNTVTNVVFTQRNGTRGYDERQVDYFLYACVQLLSRIESYARVADYVEGDAASNAQAARESVSSDVSSLFSAHAGHVLDHDAADAGSAMPRSYAPAASSASFDALHKAEQAIFAAPSATSPVAPAAPISPAPQVPSPLPFSPSASADASFAQPNDDDHHDAANGEQAPAAASSSLARLANLAASAAPVEPVASVAPTDSELRSPFPVQSQSSGEAMPVSFAPAVKPQHETIAAAQEPTPLSQQTQAWSMPVAESQSDFAVAQPASAAPQYEPAATQYAQPAAARATQFAQPAQSAQPFQTTQAEPAAASEQPAAYRPFAAPQSHSVVNGNASAYDAAHHGSGDADSKTNGGSDVNDEQRWPSIDSSFQSLFANNEQSLNLDIPDLSFPSLYSDGSDADHSGKKQQ